MLSEIFAEAVARPAADGGIPGIVAAAGRGDSVRRTWTAGLADATPGSERPVSAETLFDLASLTKIVSTTTLVLSLVGSGALDLDAPASRYLDAPDSRHLDTPDSRHLDALDARHHPSLPWGAVTIRQLLSHTSGLPATVKFYETCSSRSAVLDALFATPLESPPGTRVAYSDLGFMALGEIVSRVHGTPLDSAFRSLVAGPLGLESTGYLPAARNSPAVPPPGTASSGRSAVPPLDTASTGCLPPAPPSCFAATELRSDGTPWTGIVHDENARVMDGVAGHAGLFAPVADLARFASWWVSSSDAGPVPAALRREAERCQTLALPGRRGLGWVLRGDRYDSLTDAWPGSAVCHSGFTGTSLALDPASGAWFVLLTNRVHYGRAESAEAIKSLRRAAHTAAAPLLFP